MLWVGVLSFAVEGMQNGAAVELRCERFGLGMGGRVRRSVLETRRVLGAMGVV